MRRPHAWTVTLLAHFLAPRALAADGSLSHRRSPHESYAVAVERQADERRALGLESTEDSAVASAAPLGALDVAAVPAWESLAAVHEAFAAMRDRRFLESPERPDFPRRISWLYPDDGCFARAAMAREQIAHQGQSVAKLFIFGDLALATANAPGGSVHWAWHVVPVVRVEGELYVLDPATEPEAPLTVRDWAHRLLPDLEAASFALCSPYAYDAFGPCRTATKASERLAAADQSALLRDEWRRLEELGRDPTAELGDLPPWTN